MKEMSIFPKRLSGADKLEYLLQNYNRLFNDSDMSFIQDVAFACLYNISGRDDAHLDQIFSNLNKEMDKSGSIIRNS